MERINSEPSRKSGMFDQFNYGYLGFELFGEKDTIYYLTGGPIFKDGKLVRGVEKILKGAAKSIENLYLVSFNITDQ